MLYKLALTLLTASGLMMGQSYRVDLSWTGSTSPNISGSSVYRSTNSGGPYTKLTPSLVAGTNYSDLTPINGTTYYFVVTATNTSGQESQFSSQVTAVIPPIITSFLSNPASILPGGSSTLVLASTGATSCSIDNGVGPVPCNSSTVVTPTITTQYKATATDSSGATVTKNTSVIVSATVIKSSKAGILILQ